jgi:putative ABC transport system permease protein
MLRLALSTVRVRWPALVGAFTALLIGVMLAAVTASLMAGALSASSAGRFSNVDAVVSANGAISLGPNAGSIDPSPRPPMSDAVVSRVQAVTGVRRAVSDVAFFASAQDSSGRVLTASGVKRSLGHGWSSRELTPYTLVEGAAPRDTGQIVVERRLGVRVGERLHVTTPAGVRTFRVSGLVSANGAGDHTQAALFFEDGLAPKLALLTGQLNAVGVVADNGVDPNSVRDRLQAALGSQYKVASRSDASTADAGDPRAEQRDTVIAVMAILAGNGGAVTIFVVAGIFGLMIAQRRRELALFRAVGATPRQVRRMIAAEAFVLAIFAGLAGCVAGVLAAGPIASMLVERGIAPDGLRPDSGFVPMLLAFSIGLVLAESAVIAAAFRAGRVRAGEALRDASLGKERLGVVRGLLGLAIVTGGAIPLLLVGGLPFTALVVPMAIVLAIGIALLGPLVLALPAALLSRPLRRVGVTGLLASTSMTSGRRRVSAVAAAIALVVAIAGTQIVLSASSRAAAQHEAAERLTADRVLVSDGPGLPPSLEHAVRRLPGVTGAVGVIPLDVYIMNRGLEDDGVPRIAAGIDVRRAGRMLDLGVREGSIAHVRQTTIAISTQLAGHSHLVVGDTLRLRLPDGAEARVRVGAVYRWSAALGDLVLAAGFARQHSVIGLDEAIYVTGNNAADAGLRRFAQHVPTAVALTRGEYLDEADSAQQQEAWIVWLLIVLVAGYAAISVVNSAAMAVADRRNEIRLARLIGSTRGQVLRMITWEAAVTAAVGLAAGAAIVAGAVWRLPATQPDWHIVVPVQLCALLLAGAALLSILAAIAPTLLAIKRPVAS